MCREDVVFDAVAHNEQILCRTPDAVNGKLIDGGVGLADVDLCRLDDLCEKAVEMKLA